MFVLSTILCHTCGNSTLLIFLASENHRNLLYYKTNAVLHCAPIGRVGMDAVL